MDSEYWCFFSTPSPLPVTDVAHHFQCIFPCSKLWRHRNSFLQGRFQSCAFPACFSYLRCVPEIFTSSSLATTVFAETSATFAMALQVAENVARDFYFCINFCFTLVTFYRKTTLFHPRSSLMSAREHFARHRLQLCFLQASLALCQRFYSIFTAMTQ